MRCTVRQADPPGAPRAGDQRTHRHRARVVLLLTLATWHLRVFVAITTLPTQVVVQQLRACATDTRARQPGEPLVGTLWLVAPEKSKKTSPSTASKHAMFVASLTAPATDRWHSRAKRSIECVPRAIHSCARERHAPKKTGPAPAPGWVQGVSAPGGDRGLAGGVPLCSIMVRGAGRALRPGDLDAARQGYRPLKARAAVVYIQRAHSVIYTHTQQQPTAGFVTRTPPPPRQPSTADPYRLGLATASSVLLAGRCALAALRLRHVLVEEEQHQHEGGGVAAAHRGER